MAHIRTHHTETDRLKDFFKYLGVNHVQKLIDESVSFENDRMAGRMPSPRHRKPGVSKGTHRKRYDEEENVIHQKLGVALGTKRNGTNKDGTFRKKSGIRQGTKRGIYNKDGSMRKKLAQSQETIENVEVIVYKVLIYSFSLTKELTRNNMYRLRR